MFHFRINYVRRRFSFWPFWYVQIEVTGTGPIEKIEEMCAELEEAGAKDLSFFYWEAEDIPFWAKEK